MGVDQKCFDLLPITWDDFSQVLQYGFKLTDAVERKVIAFSTTQQDPQESDGSHRHALDRNSTVHESFSVTQGYLEAVVPAESFEKVSNFPRSIAFSYKV